MSDNLQNVPLSDELTAAVANLAQRVRDQGGRAVLVGGCVRDALLGQTAKDADLEVFGLAPDALEKLVASAYPVITVGKSFGVLKIRGLELDISLPRREKRTGPLHTDFAVDADPAMSFHDAAARRDFTLNAISWDPLTREMIDPFNGAGDLGAKVLRHTTERFAEDPLRVLRAMQFCARFEFTPAPETVALCATLTMDGISAERVFEEWKKLLVKGKRPSLGLKFLRDCGWVKYFPELVAIIGCPQDAQWHPEGDVWIHTLHCLDAFAARRTGDEWEDLVVGLAVLCHDLGKPATTTHEADGHIRSLGHEAAGEAPTLSLLARLTHHKELIESVLPLVQCHMRPRELMLSKAGDSAIRRLAKKVGRIDRLARVDEADRWGRPPLTPDEPGGGQWLLERAAKLAVASNVPTPIILGRHLIAAGLTPGPRFKEILNTCFEAQLDGKFADVENGEKFLAELLKNQ
ncbi:MAG TPA: polynucleotide adenylyltransferase [Opitutales bacterium]|jgi:tRNA nucleotidyltransferase (CCA-adding enzyme)|nr:polynucleotide adenylyltransferase [Opitutales bacterium]